VARITPIISIKALHKNLGFNPGSLILHCIVQTSIQRDIIKRIAFSNLLLEFLFDKSKLINETEGKWQSYKTIVNGISYGGLIGTGKSFVVYVQDLLKSNSRLISAEYKDLLFAENILKNGEGTNMCLSWFKGECQHALEEYTKYIDIDFATVYASILLTSSRS